MIDHANYFKKPIFLSNINVHKEQNPSNAIFFNKNSAIDLSVKLYNFLTNNKMNKKIKYENTKTKANKFYINYSSVIDNILRKYEKKI